jgi:hypothetical protein
MEATGGEWYPVRLLAIFDGRTSGVMVTIYELVGVNGG